MKSFFICVLIIVVAGLLHAQTPFNVDSATVYLKTLSVDIGPRPMGSPAERRAMEFALNKFREFGFHEAYILPFRSIAQGEARAMNTSSGTAVGILKGTSKRTIVIGGHIDSAGPEIPGANDDGSGSAVVIELARVLAQRPHESTIVFALFGGEEQGLIGSRHFVSHFPDINNVVLMLQVDMANGRDWLVPFVDSPKGSAPTWLVKASYEEFSALGYHGLSFPTHFFTLNSSIPGGGAGSDHEPFLEKDIPAIDFTSDPNDPIHTPQDSFDNFVLSGLKRSGDLVYKLTERFDVGVPKQKTDSYFFYQIGSFLLFIPVWAQQLFIVVAFLLGILTFLRLRKRQTAAPLMRISEETASAQKDFSLPGLKLFLLMLIIQACVWFSENIVALVKGLHYPWLSDLNGYLVLSFLGGLIGIWVALQVAPKLQLTRNPARYFLRAAIILSVLIALMSLVSAKLALYPAFALALLSLALLIRQPIIKIVLWLCSAHFVYHLMFSEALGLLAFSLSEAPRSAAGSLFLHLIYILFFSLWSFPFLLGFAAIRFDSGVDYFWLSAIKKRAGLFLFGGSFFIWAGILVFQPTFSNLWKQKIDVEQTMTVGSAKGSAVVRSNEYLRGTVIHWDGRDTTINGRTSEVTLKSFDAPAEPWITTARSFESSQTDSTITVQLTVRLHMRFRPYTLRVSYSAGKNKFLNPVSPLAFSQTEKTLNFRWYSFPDTSLTIPLQFRIANTDSIQESIEAVFVEPLISVTVQKNGATSQIRSIVRTSGTNSVR